MSFQWPWQYDFPPFFTIQPNLCTREKQLESWGQLVIDFCQHNKIFVIDLTEYRRSELFRNSKINRGLDDEGIQIVFDHLHKKKHVEWTDDSKRRCHIHWRRVDEWAQLLHDWAVSSGLIGSVLTFADLVEDESNRNEWQNFVHNEDKVQEGDEALIYCDSDNIVSVTVKHGITVNMKHGALRHEFIIGKRYGTKLTATAGSVYVLRPFPSIWTRVLKRHTQILYGPEISMIINLLDIKPGDIVCESGTGSGSLTHAMAVAVGSSGKVYTHDVEQPQVDKIIRESKIHGLSDRIVPALRDVTVDGFQVQGGTTAVFLDLPAPCAAVSFAVASFDRSKPCRLVSFSPCIEQVQDLCVMLTEFDFLNVKTLELIGTTYTDENVAEHDILDMEQSKSTRKAVRRNAQNTVLGESNEINMDSLCALVSSPERQPTHAGYLTSASLLPRL